MCNLKIGIKCLHNMCHIIVKWMQEVTLYNLLLLLIIIRRRRMCHNKNVKFRNYEGMSYCVIIWKLNVIR